MQTTKSSILAKIAAMPGLGALSGGRASIGTDSDFPLMDFSRGRTRTRIRTPGPRRPAGSKLARMASERRLGIGHKG